MSPVVWGIVAGIVVGIAFVDVLAVAVQRAVDAFLDESTREDS